MVIYICDRCKYTTELKGDFRRHLKRKKKCLTLYSTMTILEIKQKYNIIDKKSHPKVTQKSPGESPDVQKTSHPKVTQKSPGESPKSHPKVTQKYYCEYCNKKFAYKQGKYRHQKKRCKVLKEQKLVKYQESKIEELEKELINAKSITNNITNNNNTQNNTINININNFGSENLDYITYKDIKKHLTAGPYGAIRRLIQLVHYNKKHL